MDPTEWEPATIPFTRTSHLASGPVQLPSVAEMRTSHVVISKRSGQTIVAPNQEIVVKFGEVTKEREGQTLLFLEQCAPRVAAPRLHAMFYDDGDLFIVMERIPGVALDQVWNILSNEQKNLLTTQLRAMFDQLRHLTCPAPSYYGAVDRGPVPHHLFFTDKKGNTAITGPFPDEQHFNAGLTTQHEQMIALNNKEDFKSFFYQRHLDRVLCGHKPTFTHCDVQRKNIVVVESDTGALAPTIVDWEDAGWYPDYWEYFVAFTGFRWEDDWCRRVEDFIAAWPAEIAMMKMINADLFF